MPTMNISLPEGLKQYVEKRVEEGSYASASEYIRKLIREDEYESRAIVNPDHYHLLTPEQRQKAEDKLEALLLEGMEGEATEMTEQDWIDLRKRARARVEERRKKEAGEAS
ncbi:ribbon-helix-helix domain-containing protein [Nitrosospira multiformis]|uniref:Antitoxin ParD1/3/4 n=1 Tax=Nitrosospira multiformis TaxID=1231 RepID=A0A1I7GWY4_9PROT|nr:hypothetical protein [Nitrosospira multiformis]SFU52766.1 antitoxin ParD1/3/4 [Nitrosospira multiformis]